MTDLLEVELGDVLTEEQQEYVDMLRKSGHRLFRSLEELLKFVDIKNERLSAPDARVDLRNVAREALSSCADLCETKGIACEWDEPGGLSGWLEIPPC